MDLPDKVLVPTWLAWIMKPRSRWVYGCDTSDGRGIWVRVFYLKWKNTMYILEMEEADAP